MLAVHSQNLACKYKFSPFLQALNSYLILFICKLGVKEIQYSTFLQFYFSVQGRQLEVDAMIILSTLKI